MSLSVLFLCLTLPPSLTGLLLSLTKPDGSIDTPMLVQHISLLEQAVASLRTTTSDLTSELDATKKNLTATQSELQITKSDLQTTKTELQMSKASHNNTPVARNIAFHVSAPNSATSGVPLVYQSILYNAGSAYNITSGKFTAPVSGTYMFWTQLDMNQQRSWMYVKIMQSGYNTAVSVGLAQTGSDVYESDATAIVVNHVEKGEQVWVEPNASKDIDSNDGTFFGGVLVSVNSN
ncbi:complement C1q tumor necrosis factor-related protein 3-like [Haliotis rubra]|uniref:complement C1q tumor necrosis factor-related protein 3-like n=1 Tax=Haliotis rubra TaxID=36100 RepID=UPI001EE60CA4|nr:complement C1q tumor necrosis factor-related protein 3-like [Haliotis rubra]